MANPEAMTWATQNLGLGADASGEVWLSAVGTLGQRVQTLIGQLEAQNRLLTTANEEINRLKNRGGGDMKQGDYQISRNKDFLALEKFNGDEGTFADWEFKFHNFLRGYKDFEAYLDWAKRLDEEVDEVQFAGLVHQLRTERGPEAVLPDFAWYDDQLYSMLTLFCVGNAITTVKGCREEKCRGGRSWWRLTRDVASKSCVRLERLASAVHHPNAITDYKTGKAQLEAWILKGKSWNA